MLAALKGAVTYSPTFAVPSAWRGLPSLFGMGRGGTPALSPPKMLFHRSVLIAFALRLPTYKVGKSDDGSEYNSLQSCVMCILPFLCDCYFLQGITLQERVRAISNARLWTLLPLHLRPIYVVVFNDPMWRSYLGEGFVLRCFQHLS